MRIRACGKDYYRILGVDKTASAAAALRPPMPRGEGVAPERLERLNAPG
jgi:hypothetical protein